MIILFFLLSISEKAGLWPVGTRHIWLQIGYREPGNVVPNFSIHLSKIIYDGPYGIFSLFLKGEVCDLSQIEGIFAFGLNSWYIWNMALKVYTR